MEKRTLLDWGMAMYNRKQRGENSMKSGRNWGDMLEKPTGKNICTIHMNVYKKHYALERLSDSRKQSNKKLIITP